jgi:hypothetical protein
MTTTRFVPLLLLCAGSLAAQPASSRGWFESGVVMKPSAGRPISYSIPCVTVTPAGNLIAVWTAALGTDKYKLSISGALSSDGGRSWSRPFLLIDNPGKEDADPSLILDGKRIIVLSTTLPVPGKIFSTELWMTASEDEGKTWSKPVLAEHPHRYAEGKVHVGHKLHDGRLAVGYAWEIFCEKGLSPATEGEMDNRSGLMYSTDGGYHWTAGGDIYARPEKLTPGSVNGLDEPATVVLQNGDIFALLRNGSDHLWQSRSQDSGKTWSTPVPSPLAGHNAPAALWRLRGTNEVVVVWDNSPRYRRPLTAALSRDGCRTWSAPRVIAASDGPQVSYPSVTQAPDGTIVAVWQQDLPDRKGREICCARFNRAWLLEP